MCSRTMRIILCCPSSIGGNYGTRSIRSNRLGRNLVNKRLVKRRLANRNLANGKLENLELWLFSRFMAYSSLYYSGGPAGLDIRGICMAFGLVGTVKSTQRHYTTEFQRHTNGYSIICSSNNRYGRSCRIPLVPK